MSALAPSRPREKRRKVVSAGGGSPLATGSSGEPFQTTVSLELSELKRQLNLKAIENESLRRRHEDQERRMFDMNKQFEEFMARMDSRLVNVEGGGSAPSRMGPPPPPSCAPSPEPSPEPSRATTPDSPPLYDDLMPPSG